MKSPVLFRIVTVAAILAATVTIQLSAKKSDQTYRLMSFNILRGDLDGPENIWQNRKEACLEMLKTDAPDIFGLVECSSIQRDDVLEAMPLYKAVGVSVKGEYTDFPKTSSNSIFYRTDKFTLEDWGSYWLSDTPEVPGSNTWYYNKPRNFTWAKLRTAQGRSFIYVCIHLQDNSSSIKKEFQDQKQNYGMMNRARAVALVKDLLQQKINPEGLPVVLSGDLNARYDAFELTEWYSIFSLAADAAKVSDKGPTFNGFKKGTRRIDHIFCSGCRVSSFTVDRNPYKGIQFISDHWPVYMDFILE